MRRTSIVVAVLLALAATPAAGAEKQHSAKNAAKEAAKTGGRTARDGALTFGRSARAFFKGGPDAAKKAWRANAAKTKRTAKQGAHATKAAAGGQSAPPAEEPR